jgi:ParB family chromosome partitioning protein
MEKRVLGKGLSALIPDKVEFSLTSKPEGSHFLPVVEIRNNSLQPRTNYDDEKLAELKASIKDKGVLQPILVREKDGYFEVVAGERRLRAARELGLEEVPVILKNLTDQEALVVALVENIQREELNAIEEAEAYQKLIEEFNYTQEDIARSVGKDRSTITNLLRLLRLPVEMQKSVYEGEISVGHARALLSMEDPTLRRQLFEKTKSKGWSVREIEQKVRQILLGNGKTKTLRKRDHDVVVLEEDLQRALGTKVQILAKKKRGKIIIEYYSLDDLDRIINKLKK